MKQQKKLTRQMRKDLESYGLDPHDWKYTKTSWESIEIVNVKTGEVKVLRR